jgi:hypothetical protein
MSHKDAQDQTKDQTKDAGPQAHVEFSGTNYGLQMGINDGTVELYILEGRAGKSRHTQLSERDGAIVTYPSSAKSETRHQWQPLQQCAHRKGHALHRERVDT